MFFADGTRYERAPVVDTKDWVAEYVNEGQIAELARNGIEIVSLEDAVKQFTDSDYVRSNKKLYRAFKCGENLTDYFAKMGVASIIKDLYRLRASNIVGLKNCTVKTYDYSETGGFIIVCLPVLFRPASTMLVEGRYCLPVGDDGYTGLHVEFEHPYKLKEYPCANGNFFMRTYNAEGLKGDSLYLHAVDSSTNSHTFREVRI